MLRRSGQCCRHPTSARPGRRGLAQAGGAEGARRAVASGRGPARYSQPHALFPLSWLTAPSGKTLFTNGPGSPLAQLPAPQHRVLPIWFRDKLSCGMALAGCPQMLEFLSSLMAITKGLATWLVPFCVAAYVVTYFVMAVFFMSFWTQQHGPRMSPFCRKTRTREKL